MTSIIKVPNVHSVHSVCGTFPDSILQLTNYPTIICSIIEEAQELSEQEWASIVPELQGQMDQGSTVIHNNVSAELLFILISNYDLGY